MVVPLLAAVFLAGAAGAGPVLISDACMRVEEDDIQAGQAGAVEAVEEAMRQKKQPKALVVVAAGKLYAVPEGVEYAMPRASEMPIKRWWRDTRKDVRDFFNQAQMCGTGDYGRQRVGSGMSSLGSPPTSPRGPERRDNNTATESADPAPLSSNSDRGTRGGGSGDAAGGGGGSDGGSSNGGDRGSTRLSRPPSVKSVSTYEVGEVSCQICFEQDYDSVMLGCGHGGVCWECAVHMCAMTNECPMCREEITQVVQVGGETWEENGVTLVAVVGPRAR